MGIVHVFFFNIRNTFYHIKRISYYVLVIRYEKKAGAAGQSRSLSDEAKNTEIANLKREEEEMAKERQIETDEEQQLARSRQFDDWKDDHRRGWGNRHNMG